MMAIGKESPMFSGFSGAIDWGFTTSNGLILIGKQTEETVSLFLKLES